MTRSFTLAFVAFALASGWSEKPLLSAESSQIKRDEEVVFYPTYARLDVKSNWRVPIHGVIFEPEEDSLKRAAMLGMVHRTLGRKLSHEESKQFDRQARLFLVDHERGKSIAVRIGSRVETIGPSGANGHFSGELRFTAEEVAQLAAAGEIRDDWLPFVAVTSADDDRRFLGRVRLVSPHGLSVISDIDDTIKVSQVRDRKAMLANTFLRPFQAVPGMSDLYRTLAGRGAVVHYVSGSPWLLYPPLADFLHAEGFPLGSWQLKHFRLTDSSALDFLGSQEEFKGQAIEAIVSQFPERRFLLIGDTGEQDAEIFGNLARKRPEQIVGIYLRNSTNEPSDGPRMRTALRNVAIDRWKLFQDPTELREATLGLAERYGKP